MNGIWIISRFVEKDPESEDKDGQVQVGIFVMQSMMFCFLSRFFFFWVFEFKEEYLKINGDLGAQ